MFMEEHSPYVVVVGGRGQDAAVLCDEMNELAYAIVQHNPRALPETGNIAVVLEDETLPR